MFKIVRNKIKINKMSIHNQIFLQKMIKTIKHNIIKLKTFLIKLSWLKIISINNKISLVVAKISSIKIKINKIST